MKRKTHTYFVKPTYPYGIVPKLDPVWIAKNHQRGIITTLVLDTNVLINMEKVVLLGNKTPLVKEKGLHNLISLLERCPPASVYLSPGLAFHEMPPGLAEQCRQNYELFCARHLPQFVDSPGSIQARYAGKFHDYGYFDLDEDAQAVLAVPFCSLVYLQLVDRIPGLKPIEKFKRYLETVEKEVDLLSGKEIEIARYCFANPPAESRQIIDLRRVFRRNFMQTKEEKLPRDSAQLLQVAFNGASDLNLINSANVGDNTPIDGIQQDCWIATGDAKLAQFAELSHYVNFDGDAGKVMAPTALEAHDADPYWQESLTMFQLLRLQRAPHYQARELKVANFPKLARRAAEITEEAFAHSR
jgi:hypothetical protein